MRVLITGGNGFVGRHFVWKLQDISESVLIVDNFTPSGGALHENFWFFKPKKNVTFKNEDCRVFFNDSNDDKFDLVIHLAAVVGGRLTIENNPLAVADDLSIDATFWKWALKAKPKHIISFSSSAAYPISLQESHGHKLSENDIDFEGSLGMPDLTYGWAKLTNEYLGRIAHRKYDLNVACYRPFSGYGFDQDESYPFTSIGLRAVRHDTKEPFYVWGSGKQARDFIHIDDIVEAVLYTYTKLNDGSALNLGTGIQTNFIELAGMFLSSLKKEVEVLGKTNMPEGVHSRIANTSLLNSMGWTHTRTLNFGVEECLNYISKKED